MSDLSAVGCADCGALYLGGADLERCPSCGHAALSEAEPRHAATPERWIPRTFAADAAATALAAHIAPVWFATAELDASLLASRLVPVWWPRWLVDVDAAGIWEIEAGFDYPVESSQEVYDGGSWTTRKVTETRVRWEPRLGRVQRRYDNLVVPALADEAARTEAIGDVDLDGAEPCPTTIDTPLQLPDRSPEDQWPAVLAALREQIGADCGRAVGADHVRDLFLEVDGGGAHWTLLLVPGYATWYLDDEGQVRTLLVNGSTGQPGGPRLASPAAGRRWAMIWFATGGGIALLGLVVGVVGLVLWFLLPVAGVLVAIGAVVALAGFWPLGAASGWNRRELATDAATR